MKELQEEAGEELVKAGWTCGLNGMEKSKTKTEMGGLREVRVGGGVKTGGGYSSEMGTVIEGK